jgi:predicted SnoaL-like aldol condensation-catalyzing enzyme
LEECERQILSNRRTPRPGIKPDRQIVQNQGSEGVEKMKKTTEAKNKTIVFAAFDTLFNERDYTAAERYWSPNYIPHSALIAPGREGLFDLIKSLPPTLKYEPGTIVAEGDLVIVHGRFSGFGAPVNWVAADICAFNAESLSSIGTSFRMKRRKNSR